jgi:hypothetical protein
MKAKEEAVVDKISSLTGVFVSTLSINYWALRGSRRWSRPDPDPALDSYSRSEPVIYVLRGVPH